MLTGLKYKYTFLSNSPLVFSSSRRSCNPKKRIFWIELHYRSVMRVNIKSGIIATLLYRFKIDTKLQKNEKCELLQKTFFKIIKPTKLSQIIININNIFRTQSLNNIVISTKYNSNNNNYTYNTLN